MWKCNRCSCYCKHEIEGFLILIKRNFVLTENILVGKNLAVGNLHPVYLSRATTCLNLCALRVLVLEIIVSFRSPGHHELSAMQSFFMPLGPQIEINMSMVVYWVGPRYGSNITF